MKRNVILAIALFGILLFAWRILHRGDSHLSPVPEAKAPISHISPGLDADSQDVSHRNAFSGQVSPSEFFAGQTDSDENVAPESDEFFASLKGWVLDAAGQPIEGCEVKLANLNDRQPWEGHGWNLAANVYSATTDGAGRFRIGQIPCGSYRVDFLAPGYASEVLKEPVKLYPGDEKELEQWLFPGAELRGEVVENLSGLPIAGATVVADLALPIDRSHSQRLAMEPRFQEVSTDARGLFHFDTLVPGRKYNLHVRHPKYLAQVVEGLLSGDVEPVRFVLSPGGVVEGVVVSSTDGSFIGGAVITAFSHPQTYYGETQSATDGSFQMEGLQAGSYLFLAQWNDWISREGEDARREIKAVQKSKPLKLELIPGGAVEVTVLDSDSRRPLGGAEALVWPFMSREEKTAIANSQGQASFRGLREGRISVTASAKGYIPNSISENEGDGKPLSVGSGSVLNLTILLKKGQMLAGRVVDVSGAGIGGAEVRLIWSGFGRGVSIYDPAMMDGEGGQGRGVTTYSYPDGRFRFEGLGESVFSLVAEREGYAPNGLKSVLPGEEGVTLTLQKGGSLSGIVKDDEGNLVASAEVLLNQVGTTIPGLNREEKATTGEKGDWRFSALAEGSYRAIAVKDGRMTDPNNTFALEENQDVQEIELIFAKGSALRGKVVDKKTGKGVAEVVLEIHSENLPYPLNHTMDAFEFVTKQEGAFEFLHLLPGKYRVFPSRQPPSYQPFRRDVPPLVIMDRDVDGVVIELEPGGAVKGMVLGPSGEPVEAAYLRVETEQEDFYRWGRNDRIGSIGSDAQGRFELLGLPELKKAKLQARKKGYAPGRSDEFQLESGQTLENLIVRLELGGRISGSVRDETGNPLEDFHLSARPLDPKQDDGSYARTDARGFYRLEDLASGNVKISVSGSGLTERVEKTNVPVASGQETIGIDFVVKIAPREPPQPEKEKEKLEKPKGYLAGRVIDSKGEPVSGISVNAYFHGSQLPGQWGQGRSTTDTQGRFRLEPLMEGVYRLATMPSDAYLPCRMAIVECPSEDVEIVLQKSSGVSGRVVRKGSGEPVTSFQAGLIESEMHGGNRLNWFNHPEGRFTLERINPGLYRLRVRSEPGLVRDRMVEVKAGEDVTDFLVELDTPSGLTGQVVTRKDGRAVSGAEVSTLAAMNAGSRRGMESQSNEAGMTDADGRFTLEGLVPGWTSLQVYLSGYGRSVVDGLEVKAGEITDVGTVELPEPGFVEGYVYGADGSPQPGAGIRMYRMVTREQFRLTTDSQGFYRTNPLSPDAYYMMLSSQVSSGQGSIQKAEIGEGETVRKDFGAPGGTLWGVVTQDGIPLSGGRVFLYDEASEGMISSSRSLEAEGVYRFEHVAAGSYYLSVMLPSVYRHLARVEARLEEGRELRVDIALPSAALSGTVTAGDAGKPLPGVQVRLTFRENPSLMSSDAVTGSDGRYDFRPVMPGEYTLHAIREDYGSQSRSIVIRDGEEREGEDFRLDYGGAALCTIRDSQSGTPLTGSISFFDENGRPVFPGRVESLGYQRLYEGLPPGQWRALADEREYGVASFGPQLKKIEIQTGQTQEIEFLVQPGCQLTISAVDAMGKPLASARIRLRDGDGWDRLSPPYRAMSFGPGEKFLAAGPGTYRLEVTCEGYRSHQRTLEIPAGERTLNVKAELLREMK